MTLEVIMLNGREELASVEDEWRVLAEGNSAPTVFGRPEWGMSWLDAFPSALIKALAARRNGRLVGFLPLAKVRGGAVDLFSSRLEPLGGRLADYHIPLVDRDEPETLDVMMRALGAGNGRQVMLWQHAPADDPLLNRLKRVLDKRGWPWTRSRSVCPLMHLGRDHEETSEAWTPKLRRDVRRRRKKLNEDGLRLEVLDDLGEIHAWLEEFFEVYNRKWLGQGNPSELTDPRMRRFYHALADRMPGDVLHVSSLLHAGSRISYHFGFMQAGRFYYYKTAYRPESAGLSPTKLHVSMLVEHGCAQGWTTFDFGQGDEAYKFQWTRETVACESLVVGVNGRGPCYEWYSSLRHKTRRLFGKAVRRIRHAVQQSA